MPICPTCRAPCDEGSTRCPADGTPLAGHDPLLGKVLGERYRVLTRIGEGGMGTVYRAEHVVLRKRVAVKVLRPELSDDGDLVRRFQQEAIAASQIGQENIVDVTDFGRTQQGALYFVMEDLEGVSLAAILHASGPLPVERAARLLAQVCRALGAAHGRGIVHRDLKPDNVIVVRRDDGSDFVKVVDFGIAKSGTRPERGRLTRAGTIIGTPEYMAPEQAAAATVDHRADVYAFGVLAYELLTGHLPFKADTAIATLLEHQTRTPVPPGQLRAGLPAPFEALILKALAKRPDARQQSMAEVAADLSAVLAQFGLPPVYERPPTPPPLLLSSPTRRIGTPAPPAGPGARTPRGGTVALEAELPRPEAAPARARLSEHAPRRGRLAVAGILALAIAVAGIAAFTWRPVPAARTAAVPPSTPAAVPPPEAVPPPGAAKGASQAAVPVSSARATAPAKAAPAGAAPPARRSAAAPAGRKLGRRAGGEENPYRKLDDLKPDPF